MGSHCSDFRVIRACLAGIPPLYHSFDLPYTCPIMRTVEYIKGQYLYRILVPSAHILLSFCIIIGAFDRSRVFVLVQIFRVPCTLFIGVCVQRANVDHCG